MLIMQEYFVETPLETGEDYVFTKEQAHHAKTVVRLDHEIVRLVYQGKAFFAEAMMKEGTFIAHVLKEDTSVREMQCDVFLAIALIRKEKFELVLQKAAELGVKRIIPFESGRCVVHAKKERMDKQMQRWNTILLEASQQCKRNIVPEIQDVVTLKDLKEIQTEEKYACYENAYGHSSFLSDCTKNAKSITVVIGPEGGFSEEEIRQLSAFGYQPITLGSRILRAETAAIYCLAVLSEIYEVRQ